MQRRFEVEGREHRGELTGDRGVSFRPGAEGFVMVTVDGVQHRVEVMERGAHHLDLILDGERRLVLPLAASSEKHCEVWVSVGGRPRLIREVETRDEGTDAGSGQQTVTPQFPATVIKIHIEVGDAISQGQPLVTVSAMKMEMTLSAPHDGTVSAINTDEGATVSPGDVLVEIEEDDDA